MKRSTSPNIDILGIPISDKAFCSTFILEKHEDVVTRHNKLQDTRAETCCCAYWNVKVEAGINLTHDHSPTCPADILVPNWSLGKPATFDLSVTSLLNSNVLLEAGLAAGQAASATEERQHEENDAKCKELGAFAYGVTWVTEAVKSFHFWPTLQPSSPDVLSLLAFVCC